MRRAFLDLVAGATCPGCGRAGELPCADCARALGGMVRPARPTPPPPGLAPAYAAGTYDGLLRALLLGHKERHQFGLAELLGGLLADAVLGLCAEHGVWPGADLVLVPAPSQAAATRGRGYDPTRRLTRVAARRLGARVAPLLGVGRVRDQGDLGREERLANLARAMSVRPGPATRLARSFAAAQVSGAWVVVCDDVLTTGATAREAQRALTDAGWGVLGIATVAATSRRAVRPSEPDADRR